MTAINLYPYLTLTPQMAKPSGRRSILAVTQLHRPYETFWSIARATEVARARSARLDVVAVLPVGLDDGRAWIRRWKPSVGGRLFVRAGHPTATAAEIARETRPELVVAGARPGTGGLWARLVRRLDIPVMVARPKRRRASVIAATDFSVDHFPVLDAARTMSRGSRRGILMLHNVDPAGRSFSRQFGFSLGHVGIRKLRDLRADKLHAFAENSGPDVEAVLSGCTDPVSAIREHAARRDADLVIAGAHLHRGLRSPMPRQRTADRIVERVATSTLLLPLPPHGLASMLT